MKSTENDHEKYLFSLATSRFKNIECLYFGIYESRNMRKFTQLESAFTPLILLCVIIFLLTLLWLSSKRFIIKKKIKTKGKVIKLNFVSEQF